MNQPQPLIWDTYRYQAAPVEAVMVHRNEDGEEALHVRAHVEGELVLIRQGSDLIIVPLEEAGAFLDALESLVQAPR